jgi:hypothetical protein
MPTYEEHSPSDAKLLGEALTGIAHEQVARCPAALVILPALGVKDKTVARLLRVNPTLIANWRTGNRRPPVMQRGRLVALLKIFLETAEEYAVKLYGSDESVEANLTFKLLAEGKKIVAASEKDDALKGEVAKALKFFRAVFNSPPMKQQKRELDFEIEMAGRGFRKTH